LEDQVKQTKTPRIPAIFFQGQEDGINPPKTSEKRSKKFSGPFERIVLPGVGHFPTREAPDHVADLLIRHFTTGK
jgi:pimeloyl-ACP methyl ester carboxylesterase